MTKSIMTPIKLVEAYSSLTKMSGTSFTNTSRNMPPPTAVKNPCKRHCKKVQSKYIVSNAGSNDSKYS
jgi:hypothetical protein